MQKILIVSGRSGSGKSAALSILEDLGFYCIDNLPLSLLADIVAKLSAENKIDTLALGLDVRTPESDLLAFEQVLDKISQFAPTEVLFLNARDDVLQGRFAATRRKHPLADRFSTLNQALDAETFILSPIVRKATITLDTSSTNPHQLQQILALKLHHEHRMVVIIESFGFKRGVPMDADLMFDVRHLPNPHWNKQLREQTGLNEDVQHYLQSETSVNEMFADILQLLNKWLPEYAASLRPSITIAIGCTGGQHRSVYLVDRLTKVLQDKWQAQSIHRESKYWP